MTLDRTARVRRYAADLDAVLAPTARKLGTRRVEELRARLERVINSDVRLLSADPMLVRRGLIEQLRSEGASRGTIEHFEQLFMGTIRRAAVAGLLPPPPEGPWTRRWQAILEGAPAAGTRAAIRHLAAWATARNLEPDAVDDGKVHSWSRDAFVSEPVVANIRRLLAAAAEVSTPADRVLLRRLRQKATNGRVTPLRRREAKAVQS